MRREQLEHLIRAAGSIAGEDDLLVIGSQAILGSYPEGDLPEVVTVSIEANVAFFQDPEERKADLVDGSIGEESPSNRPSATTPRAFQLPPRCCPRDGGIGLSPCTTQTPLG